MARRGAARRDCDSSAAGAFSIDMAVGNKAELGAWTRSVAPSDGAGAVPTAADRDGDSERMQEATRRPAKAGAPFALAVGGPAGPRAEGFSGALGEDLESWFTVHAAPVSQRLEGAAEAIRAWRPPRMGGPTRQTAYRRNPGRRFDKAEQRPSLPNRPKSSGSTREVARHMEAETQRTSEEPEGRPAVKAAPQEIGTVGPAPIRPLP